MPSFQLAEAVNSERSSLYRAMQQQAFYFISRKHVHDVQQLVMPMHGYAFRLSVAHAHYEKLATGAYGGPYACFPPYLWRIALLLFTLESPKFGPPQFGEKIPSAIRRFSIPTITTSSLLLCGALFGNPCNISLLNRKQNYN
ncbi:hypothetical protein NQ318_008055 [Aromia moschata]|uniref:Uncharacterized protein n=1 Tax=Aromia moschata TaxID=1265417 RepID=A0AAV8XDP1_9CUCU|nr:hypothetical protein NQ318_008055 [Aromia moschata]